MLFSNFGTLSALAIAQNFDAKSLLYVVVKLSFKCWQQKARTTVCANTFEALISPWSPSLIRVVASIQISGIDCYRLMRKYSQELFSVSTIAQARIRV